jgi:hypothetical protein
VLLRAGTQIENGIQVCLAVSGDSPAENHATQQVERLLGNLPVVLETLQVFLQCAESR